MASDTSPQTTAGTAVKPDGDLLVLDDVQAGYGRAAMVLRGLTIRVPASTVVCLVGPNGAGKSNLLDVIDFLGDSVREDLAPALSKRGGFDRGELVLLSR